MQGWAGGRRHKDGVGKRMASSRKGGTLLVFPSIASWKSKEILNGGLLQAAVVENAGGFAENLNPTVLGL